MTESIPAALEITGKDTFENKVTGIAHHYTAKFTKRDLEEDEDGAVHAVCARCAVVSLCFRLSAPARVTTDDTYFHIYSVVCFCAVLVVFLPNPLPLPPTNYLPTYLHHWQTLTDAGTRVCHMSLQALLCALHYVRWRYV